MKKVLLSSCIILSLGMQTFAQAQTNTSNTSSTTLTKTTTVSHHKHHRACMPIAVACESAGYRLSKDVPGKNIWNDCVKPILSGKTISGVSVDSSVVQNCKQHREHMKEHMKEWKHHHNMMQTTPASTSTSTTTTATPADAAPAPTQPTTPATSQ